MARFRARTWMISLYIVTKNRYKFSAHQQWQINRLGGPGDVGIAAEFRKHMIRSGAWSEDKWLLKCVTYRIEELSRFVPEE